MYKKKSFLCIIPARGGSKGIPKKNIIVVNDKPLIQYTIDAALASKYIDDIIISTDDVEIAEVCEQLGVSVPYFRPDYLATDQAKTIDSVIHVIKEQSKLGKTYDYVITLQPTQPLRKKWHIDEAIEKIVTRNKCSLVSVTKVQEHPILMKTLDEDDMLTNLLNINSNVRRQDFPDVYKVNGAIYVNRVDTLDLNTNLNDNSLSYIMDNKYDIDIDDTNDLSMLRRILK